MTPRRRRRAWLGFALFATLAILGLFVLDSTPGGVTLFVALLVFIFACMYALHGEDPDGVAKNQRTGWFGAWF